eukprot:TRINITY_DN23706_c0_g1_i6.p1 TRINITY_DN23706_c0_g1~~TRINITY_DN23706_c0_g1_i6.p1  ORF type:complete len:3232 (+),score=913.77 TRINITY_DN23706_c0_g1_i6:398-9697(+)
MSACGRDLYKTDDLMSLDLENYYLLADIAAQGAYSPSLHPANKEATLRLSTVPQDALCDTPTASSLSFFEGRSMVVAAAVGDHVTCHVHSSITHSPPESLLRNICEAADFMFRRTLVIPAELVSMTTVEHFTSFSSYRRYGVDVVVFNAQLTDPTTLSICRHMQKVKGCADFVLNFNSPVAPLLSYPHTMLLQTADDEGLKKAASTAAAVDVSVVKNLRREAANGRRERLKNNPVPPIPKQGTVGMTTSNAVAKEVIGADDKKGKLCEAVNNGCYEGVAQALSLLDAAVVDSLVEEVLAVLVKALASRSVPQQQRGHALQVLTFLLGKVGSPKHGTGGTAEGVDEGFPVEDAVGCRYRLQVHGCAAGPESPYDLSKMKLVQVPTTVSNVVALCRALECSAPIIVEGGTGLGKTSSVEDACRVMGKKHVRFNLSASITIEDIIGRVQLDPSSSGLTPYTDAFVNGHVLVLDECNLAQEEVLSLIEGSLDTGELVTNKNHFLRHKDFRLIVTQNPTAGMFSGKRETLSDAFVSRFRRLNLSSLQHNELQMLVRSLLGVTATDTGSIEKMKALELCTSISCMHAAVSAAMFEDDNPLSVITMRDLKFVCQSNTGLVYRAYVVYCCRILSKVVKQKCVKIVEKFLSADKQVTDSLPALKGFPGVGGTGKGGCIVTSRVYDLWKCLDVAAGCGRPVLVVGDVGCGKSCAVKSFGWHLAGKMGSNGVIDVHMTEDTDTGSLIGQYMPTKDGEGSLVQWVDGPVVTAMRKGAVLLLDDLLSAPPVVVERLNSALEADPELLVSENNSDTHIKAGRGFQILATGDINAVRSMTPALANRFIVIVMETPTPASLADEIRLLVEGSGFKGSDVEQVSSMCQLLCKDKPDIRAVTRVLKKANTVEAFKAAVLSMHSSESWFGGFASKHVLPSLSLVSKSVKWCTGAHIPVLLIDERSEYDAATLLHDTEHDSVLCTELSQVSEWWGVTLPKSKGVMTVRGPLYTAYTEGHTLVLEGYHNLPHCQMAELAALLDRCTHEEVKCHDNFAVVATCTLEGLRSIPDRWRKMFHEVVLPQPTAQDYKMCLAEGGVSADDVAEKAVCLRDVVPVKMDIRVFRKVMNRVNIFLGGRHKVENWGLAIASLFANYPNITGILQSEGLLPDDMVAKVRVPASITREAAMISFTGYGITSTVNVPSQGDDSRFALFVSSLTQPIVAAVVATAHAIRAGETIVLSGPPGYKSFSSEAYFSIVEGEYEVVHLTCMTDHHDLIGRLCPYNRDEFKAHVDRQIALVLKQDGEGISKYCEGLRNMLEEAKEARIMFAFKDGAVGGALKARKGVVYEHAGLAGEGLPHAMSDCLLKRRLPLGLVPVSRRCYLACNVPQIIIYSCASTVMQPPGYTQLTVYNCNAYTDSEAHDVLAASLNHGSDDDKREIVSALYKLCPKQSLRSALRWVSFINNYPDASLSQRQILVCGYNMLFKDHSVPDRRDSVASLRWSDTAIEAPSPKSVNTMHGYIQNLWHFTNLKLIQPKLKNCVLNRSLCKNLARVLAASTLSIPLLLEGLPGIGKGFVVEQAARLMEVDYKRVQMSSGMTIDQLFGCTMPAVRKGAPVFEFREGVLSSVLKATSTVWVLLDELNLAPHDVQQALIPVLATRNPRVRFFSAVNPVEVGGGRAHIPASLKELFATISLADLDREEVLMIGRSKLEGIHLPEVHVKEILAAYEDVRGAVVRKAVGEGDELFNIRTLEKVALLLAAKTSASDGLRLDPVRDNKVFNRYVLRVLDVVFAWGFSSKEDRAKVSELVRQATPSLGKEQGDDGGGSISIKDQVIDFDGVKQERGMATLTDNTEFSMSAEMKRRLLLLSAASSSSLCVLLEGPTASGKTSLVREYARLCGRELKVISMAPNIEGSDLIGTWSPFKFTRSAIYQELLVLASYIDDIAVMKALQEVISTASEEGMKALCDAIMKASDVKRDEASRIKDLIADEAQASICFRFTMSRLLKAVLHGDWVLLDNADWAPQEALERLNSLLEADTSLQLFEISSNERALRKGDGIHRNFRLFMTTNPERKHATRMSQALFNRVIKIHVQCTNPANLMPMPTKHHRMALAFHKQTRDDVRGGTCRSLIRSLSSWRETRELAVLCDNLVVDHMPALSDGVDEQRRAYNAVLRTIIADLYSRDEADEDEEDGASESSEEQHSGEADDGNILGRQVSDLVLGRQYADYGGLRDVGVFDDMETDLGTDAKPSGWDIKTIEGASGIDTRGSSGFLISHDKEGLVNFGHSLAAAWRCKPGGVIEEVVGNLVAPPGCDKLAVISSVCEYLETTLQSSYPKLTPVHLLVMKIYTMEGPDVDRLMGFQNVPVFLEDKEGWRSYKEEHKGKRNSQVYTEVNTAIRTLSSTSSGVAKVEAQALFAKWIKFVSVLICIGEVLAPVTLYRSVKGLSRDVMEKYQKLPKGCFEGWAPPTSTSRKEGVDQAFIGGKEDTVRFRIHNVSRGVYLRAISAYPDEDEVLLPPFTSLEAIGVSQVDGYTTVDFKYTGSVCWDNAYLRGLVLQVIKDANDSNRRLKRMCGGTEDEVSLEDLPVEKPLPLDAVTMLHGAVFCTNDPIKMEYAAPLEPLSLLALAKKRRRAFYEKISSIEVDNTWKELTAGLASCVKDTVLGLEKLLTPNVFTRAQASTNGSTLYIPGLIKAITTNFTYNKVFASKTAGGKRSYSVVLAFDTSLSKKGIPLVHYQIVDVMVRALAELSVPCTVLVYSGVGVYIVKTPEDAWNSNAITAFRIAAARFTEREGTAGWRAACRVALETPARRRYVFVLSAGETPWTDPEVTSTVSSALSASVDVVGLGTDLSIHAAFPVALSFPNTSLLGTALMKHAEGEVEHPSITDSKPQNLEDRYNELVATLASLQPQLDKAYVDAVTNSGCDTITKADVSELQAMAKPPQDILTLYEALRVLLRYKKSDRIRVSELVSHNFKLDMTPEMAQTAVSIVAGLDVEQMKKKSFAGSKILGWVLLQPAIADLQEQVNDAQRELTSLKQRMHESKCAVKRHIAQGVALIDWKTENGTVEQLQISARVCNGDLLMELSDTLLFPKVSHVADSYYMETGPAVSQVNRELVKEV